jgi:branched-chain amino acid transport system ATP-binding protein
MSVLLEVTGLTKSFGGVRAVRDVGFTLGRAEMLAIIGPNGAGKSTCFNMVGGQIRPDSGTVVFEDENIAGKAPREIWRRGVGRTFQISATFMSMTVRENVQMALMSHHGRIRALLPLANRLYVDEAMAILERIDLVDRRDQMCGVLAYGDLKRVELAMAIAHRPKLLLMDEPTAGMSPSEREALMQLTASIVSQEGMAVLFTEHDMDVVFAHSSRIVVMNRGAVVTVGTPAEVRNNVEVKRIYLGGTLEAAH